ncbi:MAG: hypothetical protein C4308_07330 [Chitinophagaceae bacterium]
MNNSTQNTELLMRYIDSELSGAEKQAFEQQLTGNAELKKEYNSFLLAKQAVNSYGIQQQVATVHKTMMQEFKSSAKVVGINSRRKIIRWTIAVAASVLLIFIGIQGYNFYQLSADKLFNEQYSGYELGTTRDSQNLSLIETAYKSNNYQQVVNLVKKQENASAEDRFLQGLSYLQLNNLAEAIQSFNAVISINKGTNQGRYKDEAEYYLALSYLKNRDYDQAVALMKNIHNDPNHLYHKKFSDRFIRKVKMLKWR